MAYHPRIARIVTGILAVLVIAAVVFFLLPANPEKGKSVLRISALPGVCANSVIAAIPEADAEGIRVEIVEFTDWATPNVALDSGDLDLHYGQHRPFMENAIRANGFQIASAGEGFLPNVGLYSLKYKTLEEIPENGKIALANDPVNLGRGLLLLQKAGLITLRPDVGYLGTLADITENPRKFSFIEVDGPQLVRAIADVDIAYGFPGYITASGAFDASSGLIYSGLEDRDFTLLFASHAKRTNDPLLLRFIALYKASDAVKAAIHKGYNQDTRLYSLPWATPTEN
jgi:D-methionine transport system substrate-binding protein